MLLQQPGFLVPFDLSLLKPLFHFPFKQGSAPLAAHQVKAPWLGKAVLEKASSARRPGACGYSCGAVSSGTSLGGCQAPAPRRETCLRSPQQVGWFLPVSGMTSSSLFPSSPRPLLPRHPHFQARVKESEDPDIFHKTQEGKC